MCRPGSASSSRIHGLRVTIDDFSVDQACQYGTRSYGETTPGTRIVQLTLDVESTGDRMYFVDDPEGMTDAGYTQKVEDVYRWGEDPTDGATPWWQDSTVDPGETKELYGAFEVQEDASKLVLISDSGGRFYLDMPSASTDGDGAPELATSAG